MVVKSQIILYIYDKLKDEKMVTIDEVINKFEISIRTFQRYIAEIKAFLFNNFKDYSLEYNRTKKIYYLKKLNNYLVV